MKKKVSTKILETVMVSGYAPAPHGSAMQHQFGNVGVILEIDLSTDTIVDGEFTFITNLAKGFFVRLIQGYDLNDGPNALYNKIRSRCWTPSTEAIVACMKIAIQRYLDTKNNM